MTDPIPSFERLERLFENALDAPNYNLPLLRSHVKPKFGERIRRLSEAVDRPWWDRYQEAYSVALEIGAHLQQCQDTIAFDAGLRWTGVGAPARAVDRDREIHEVFAELRAEVDRVLAGKMTQLRAAYEGTMVRALAERPKVVVTQNDPAREMPLVFRRASVQWQAGLRRGTLNRRRASVDRRYAAPLEQELDKLLNQFEADLRTAWRAKILGAFPGGLEIADSILGSLPCLRQEPNVTQVEDQGAASGDEDELEFKSLGPSPWSFAFSRPGMVFENFVRPPEQFAREAAQRIDERFKKEVVEQRLNAVHEHGKRELERCALSAHQWLAAKVAETEPDAAAEKKPEAAATRRTEYLTRRQKAMLDLPRLRATAIAIGVQITGPLYDRLLEM